MTEKRTKADRFTEALGAEVDSAFKKLASEIFKGGALTVKDKALIALACSVAVRCESCIQVNRRRAQTAGASQEEILEAAALAGIVRLGSGFNAASVLLEDMEVRKVSGSIKCQNCGKEISDDELFISEGKTLCEDCYIDVGHRIRVCDPWGERSKKIFRESHGLTGTDGLTDLQKDIYEFIKTREKATREEIAKAMNISPRELENEFAILRHCQLVKGKKEDDKVYLVLW